MKKQSTIITNIIFLFSILISYLNYARCDLPVHCLVSDIEGEWTIRINKEKFDAGLNFLSSCGHGLPNKIEDTIGDKDFSFQNYNDLHLTLDSQYKVYENGSRVGEWTPVYDQSFVIYYKNSILTAPYKYYKGDSGDYKSNCSKTMVGWYVPDINEKKKNWSCFFSFKKSVVVEPTFLQKSTIISSEKPSFVQTKTKTYLNSRLKYEHLNNVVNQINNANLSWKAAVHEEFKGLSMLELREHLGMRSKYAKYQVLQKKDDNRSDSFTNNNKPISSSKSVSFIQIASDSATDSEDFDSEKAFADLMANLEKTDKDTEFITTKEQTFTSNSNQIKKDSENSDKEKDSHLVFDYKETSKYLDVPIEAIDENKLPRNWDWRNVGGKNYIPSIKRQGNCGSCYVFSTISCLEARLRIKTDNQDRTEFSKQFPISCNFYSEGCDGGYPMLVGKFLHEFEIVPEDCFTYKQKNDSCSNVCDYTKNKKKYTVSKYGYLGGFYGATNEILMMKELRARGPIPGNIRVPSMFNYYSNGIFSESSLKQNADKLSKVTLVDRHLTWEKVEHSITLVGYGEENGVKYWIGMNTWGSDWGEQGFFKILRGENECSVESMGDFIDIEITSR